MAETARLFVSVDVSVTDEVREVMSVLRDVRNIRVPPESQMHITLSFLGDTDTARIPGLVKELKGALSDVRGFGMSLKGLGAFPDLKRPRVVWIGTDEGRDDLVRLAGAVRTAVKKCRLRQDDKPFSPHVTVARVQGPANIGSIAGRYADTVFSRFTVDSVKLMRSVLGPSGAKHTVVERFPLGQED